MWPVARVRAAPLSVSRVSAFALSLGRAAGFSPGGAWSVKFRARAGPRGAGHGHGAGAARRISNFRKSYNFFTALHV